MSNPIITLEMIEAVRPYVLNADDVSTVHEVSKYISSVTERKFTACYVIDGATGSHLYATSEYLNVTIFTQDGDVRKFIWQPWMPIITDDDATSTLNDFMNAGFIAGKLYQHRASIEVLIDFDSLKKFRTKKLICDSARWCFERMEKFYNLHQQDKCVDVDAALTKLWKMKQDEWSKSIKPMHTKDASFKTMRAVRDEFYSTYQKIIAL
jgi:hypothetical protein